MTRILFPISTLLLSSAIVFVASEGASPWSLPEIGAAMGQTPAAPPVQPPAPAAKNPVKPTSESLAKAKKTYSFDCALCHGENGNGKTDLAKDMQLTLADLTDPKTLADKSDGELFQAIRNGKEKMPAEAADRAKDDDVWNLVIYVRNLAKGGVPAPAQ